MTYYVMCSQNKQNLRTRDRPVIPVKFLLKNGNTTGSVVFGGSRWKNGCLLSDGRFDDGVYQLAVTHSPVEFGHQLCGGP